MATADVLAYARSKDPRFNDVPDAELLSYVVAKEPKFRDALDTRDKAKMNLDSTRASIGASPNATPGEMAATIQQQGKQAQATEVKQGAAKAYSTFVRGAIPVAASLATGGVGLWPALAIMGGAGLGGSLLGTAVEEASGIHKSLGERAKEAALDTGLSVLGEGMGRGIAYAGKRLLPQALAASAARSQKGQELLANQEKMLLDSIYKEVQGAGRTAYKAGVAPTNQFLVDISKPVKRLVSEFDKLPQGSGPLMKRFGGITDKAQEGLDEARSFLQLARRGGMIGDLQPLDQVIRMKRSLQQFAFDPALGRDEATLFRSAARGVNDVVVDNLKLFPSALQKYNQVNEIAKASLRATAASQLGEILVRRAISAGVGGAIGQHFGGSKGALAGAILGASTPHVSTLILEHVASNPKARVIFREATHLMSENAPRAMQLGARAFGMVNADRIIADSVTPDQP